MHCEVKFHLPQIYPFTNWSEVFSSNHQLSGSLCRASIECHASDACVDIKEEESASLASLCLAELVRNGCTAALPSSARCPTL